MTGEVSTGLRSDHPQPGSSSQTGSLPDCGRRRSSNILQDPARHPDGTHNPDRVAYSDVIKRVVEEDVHRVERDHLREPSGYPQNHSAGRQLRPSPAPQAFQQQPDSS